MATMRILDTTTTAIRETERSDIPPSPAVDLFARPVAILMNPKITTRKNTTREVKTSRFPVLLMILTKEISTSTLGVHGKSKLIVRIAK